jgi:hypothetical protein
MTSFSRFTVAILSVLISLIVAGCSSSTKQPGIKLVGNMSLVSVASRYDQSYKLLLQSDTAALFVLPDYVIETFGNDSILIAKCINEKGAINYYKLIHWSGQHPENISSILVTEYNTIRDSSKITFNFTDDVRYNWR